MPSPAPISRVASIPATLLRRPVREAAGPSSEIPVILERLAKQVLPRQLAAKRQPDAEDAAQAA